MNLLTIAWKSVRQRSLSSTLTALSIALGIMLMVSVLVIFGVVEGTFSQRSINYDLIIGPKGSPLQLVLSTVYHVSPPIENLPYKYYRDMRKDPRVSVAIPIAFGDVTEEGSFPIVGTTPQFFEIDYAPRRPFLVNGDFLRKSFDAVIGDRVAKDNGWALGTKFKLVHGGADTGHVHDEEFEVKGILAPTGSPHDKTVYVNLEGFYMIEGHDKPIAEAIERERKFYGLPPLAADELAAQAKRLGGHEHEGHDHAGHDHQHAIPDVQKEVTAVLVQCKTQIAANLLAGELKKGYQAMGVNPIQPMQQLFTDVLGGVRTLLIVLTGLIVIVSGIGIFVSIYNSMSARQKEIAIMRALGARRTTVFGIILLESILLCVGGGLCGLLLGHGLVFVAAPVVEARSGILMDPLAFDPWELVLFPVLLGVGSFVGFLPGMAAYRTDVAQTLSGQ